jgi:hypothetical protein
VPPHLSESERAFLVEALRPVQERYLTDPADERAAAEPWRQFAKYRDDPVGFVHEVVGAKLTAYSRAFLISLRDRKRTTVRASRSAAKTFTYAMATLWWMCTRNGVVLVFGAREDNIKNQVFAEIGLWHAKSKTKLPGRVDNLHWRLGPRQFAQGIATKHSEGAQGFHAGRAVPDDPDSNLTKEELVALYEKARADSSLDAELLILCDEAVAIPNPIIHALMGSVQGPVARMAMVANPLIDPDDEHEFSKSHGSADSGWWRIWVQARERTDEMGYDEKFVTPNWLVDEEFVEHAIKSWGPDDPRTLAYVYGIFSRSLTDNQFFPRALLLSAMALDIPDDKRAESCHIGVDVGASESGDPCVASLFVSGVLSCEYEWRTPDLMASAGVVVELMSQWSPKENVRIPASNVHIDDCGVGKGVSSRLHQQGLWVDAVDVGAGPQGDWSHLTGVSDAEFKIRKDELWWAVRCLMQEGRICIPQKYKAVWQQLQWHGYGFESVGKKTRIFHTVKKDDIQDRYGRSPDNADAAILAWSRTGGAPRIRAARDLKGLKRLLTQKGRIR